MTIISSEVIAVFAPAGLSAYCIKSPALLTEPLIVAVSCCKYAPPSGNTTSKKYVDVFDKSTAESTFITVEEELACVLPPNLTLFLSASAIVITSPLFNKEPSRPTAKVTTSVSIWSVNKCHLPYLTA